MTKGLDGRRRRCEDENPFSSPGMKIGVALNLSDLISPEPMESFLRNTWGSKIKLYKGPNDRFSQLFSWHDLSRLITEHRHLHPRLRLSKEGQVIPRQRFMKQPAGARDGHDSIDVPSLYAELRNGAMLVLDSVDELVSEIRSIAWNLENVFRERVVINAYAGWSHTEGFDLHWDDHDVIIMQIYGSKQWNMFGETRAWPMKRDVEPNEEAPKRPIRSLVVSAGDVLYVPRGNWHQVRAVDLPSLHLTIGVTRRTGHDFLVWVADDLINDPLTRQDIPRHHQEAEIDAYIEEVRERVLDRIQPANLRRFLYTCDTTADISPRVSLGALDASCRIADDHVIEWLAPRAVLHRPVGDTVSLGAGGRLWTYNRLGVEVLRLLMHQRRLSFGELMAALPAESRPVAASFVRELQEAGLVSVDSLPRRR